MTESPPYGPESRFSRAAGTAAPSLTDRPRLIVVSAHALVQDILVTWLDGFLTPSHTESVARLSDLPDHALRADGVILGDIFQGIPAADVPPMVLDARALVGDVPVIVVSDHHDGAMAARCIRLGARGVIPTCATGPVAAAAFRLVLSGGTYIPPAALAPASTALPDTAPDDPPEDPIAETEPDTPPAELLDAEAPGRLGLSPRETQILLLVRSGCSNRAIAATLAISENTVMVHMRNLMRKLGATNRTQAVFNAHQRLAEATSPEAAPAN